MATAPSLKPSTELRADIHEHLRFIRERAHPNANTGSAQTIEDLRKSHPIETDIATFIGEHGENIGNLIVPPDIDDILTELDRAAEPIEIIENHLQNPGVRSELNHQLRCELIRKLLKAGRHFRQNWPDSAIGILTNWYIEHYGFYPGSAFNIKEFERLGVVFTRTKCQQLDDEVTFKIITTAREGALRNRLHQFLVAVAWSVVYTYLKRFPDAELVFEDHPRDLKTGAFIKIKFDQFKTQLLALNAAEVTFRTSGTRHQSPNDLFSLRTNMLKAWIRLGDGSVIRFARFMNPIFPTLTSQIVIVGTLRNTQSNIQLEEDLAGILDATGLPKNRDLRSFGPLGDFFKRGDKRSAVFSEAKAVSTLAYSAGDGLEATALRFASVLEANQVLYDGILATHVYELRVGDNNPSVIGFLDSEEGKPFKAFWL